MRRRNLIILLTAVAVVGVLAIVGVVAAVGLFLSNGDDGSASRPVPSGAGSAAWAGALYAEPVGYTVQDRELFETDSGAPADEELAAAWSLFVQIAGARVDEAKRVAVSDDVEESTMASVARDPEDPNAWDVEINMAFASDPAELEATMVHEYGHMYSLSADQAGEVAGSCPTFEFSEGCLNPDGVLARFMQEFWADDPVGAAKEDATEEEATQRFLAEGENGAFVSEYAATNGAEDFAETFANYVLNRDTSKWDTGSVALAKVEFLAADPATSAERDRIRSALGLD